MGMFDDLIPAQQGTTPRPMPPPAPPQDMSMFADLLPKAGGAPPSGDSDRPLTIHGRQSPGPEIQVDPSDRQAVAAAANTLDPANAPGMASSGLRGVAQGMTFGFGDEMRGLNAAAGYTGPASELVGGARLGAEALAPGVFGHGASDRYDQQVSQARAENEIAQNQNPGSYLLGELGGGAATLPVAPALAPFKAAEGAGIASQAAAGLGNLAATGAAYGGIAGAGGADSGLSNRLTGAAEGAALGGVVNPAFGSVAAVAGGAVGKAADFVRRDLMARNDPGQLADQIVGKAIQRDATTPQALIDGMTTPPAPVMDQGAPVAPQGPRAPNGMLTAADVGGPNVQGLAGNILRTPGEAQTAGRAMLDARQFGSETVPSQGERAQSAIDSMMGKSLARDAVDQIIAKRSADAAPFYEAFRNSRVPTTDGLAELMQKPSIKAAFPGAARKLADDQPGSSLFADRGSKWERDVFGDAPVGEPDRPFSPLPDDIGPAVKPSVPRPQTLANFLQSAGGVRDTGGNLTSMGLNRFPGLVRKSGGLSPDMARQAAAQAGYLGADIDRAMSETDINDLLNALDNPAHTSVLDDDAAAQWSAYDDHRAAQDRAGSSSQPREAAPPRAPKPDHPDDRPPEVTARGWDYVKRSLDDKIGEAQRAGRNDDVRIYTGLKRSLLDEIDKVNPYYANARKIFAGHSEMIDAVRDGVDAFKPSTSADDMGRALAGYKSAAEKEAYRLSAAQALKDNLAKLVDGADKARAIAKSPLLRAKVKLIAPDPASEMRLMSFVSNEAGMSKLRAQIGNSATAERQAVGSDMEEQVANIREGAHLAHNVATMNMPALFMAAMRHLSRISPELRSQVLDEARKIILNPDPSAMRSFEERLAASAVPAGPRQAFLGTMRKIVSSSTTAAPRALVGAITQVPPDRQRDRPQARSGFPATR